MNKRAVVFAYHNVGVRCLRVLLARDVSVELVVTHEDSPAETIWFDSVRELAQAMAIPVMVPASPADPELSARLAEIAPDFIFSFYYRHMIPAPLLSCARDGAYNMHGSLLPKYRGRAPVNWAVLHGESETGATLHEMVAKPDAGDILAWTAVPILPDDTAVEVFSKVTVAAEMTLWNILPAMLAGSAPRLANDLSSGSYFGARKPEDGRIDWTRPAREVHNLIRAVAPPYPGAFCDLACRQGVVRLQVERARLAFDSETPGAGWAHLPPGLAVLNDAIFGLCGDGRAIRVLRISRDHHELSSHDVVVLTK